MSDRTVRPRYRDELRAVLDSMLEGVLVLDGRGRVIQRNDAAQRLLNPLRERDRERLKRAIEPRAIRNAAVRVLAGGRPESMQIKRAEEARDVVLQVRVSPLAGKRGALAGAVIVVHDVSELDRLATVRQEFIANVSHELKTPVTAILAMADTLVDDPELDADTHASFLERIRDQAERLRSVVSDLLTLSRLDATDAEAMTEVLDLAGPVRDAVDALGPVAAAKEPALEVSWADGPLLVQAAREDLRQAASNLIDNAIKYTAAGGRVTVSLQRVPSHSGRPAAELEVRDTGIGIAAADQQRVFERFFRVDRALREAGGTGLGLAIVKHVARRTGGRITLQSAPGQGSRFAIRWPLAHD